MKQQQLEFFKLDEIDRKVLLWLIDHVHPNAIKSWLEFIAGDYKRRHSITIDAALLFKEIENR